MLFRSVDGVSDIFKGAVQTYSSHDELVHLLSDPSVFPNDDELLEISSHVREMHSFTQRSQELINRVEWFTSSVSEVPEFE